IQLFDYIRKSGQSYKEDQIVEKLYGKSGKNAFYRLKNRLLSDINKSLTIQHFEDDEMIHTLHLLALAKYFYNKTDFQSAHFYLKKSETKASKIEHHELLDIIYGEFIKLSRELTIINPEPFIAKRKQNQELISNERTIDDIVAALTYRLKISQNYARRPDKVIKLLQKTVNDFTQDKQLKSSPQLRFKVYSAASQILLQSRDYINLETYLINVYQEFKDDDLFKKQNHDTKLQMLTYIVNALFKNDKIPQMLSYAAQLHDAMKEFDGFLYDKYFFFYNNSLVIYYSEVDKAKAIEILHELQEDKRIKAKPFYQVFVFLNLAVINFDLKNYSQAIKNLNKLYLLDSYKNTDRVLQFKVAVAELIIRYEFNDFDLLEYKMGRLNKDYGDLLANEDFLSEKDLMSIIQDMLKIDKPIRNKEFKRKLTSFLKQESKLDKGDAEIIRYDTWLSDKFRLQ
ncbi:MAG: hypothetical protein HKN22_04645, partial [Bacteroidia bacterium]|nr:hypothetical protein [Bacteroidia bacterium]